MRIIIIVSIITVGIITGMNIHGSKGKNFIGKIITILIWLLLFLLGVEAGSNVNVISNFNTLGAEAFLLTLSGLAGSIFFSWILWHYINSKSK